MTVAILLFIILLIWRLYKIGKIVLHYEFWLSLIAFIILISSMTSNSYIGYILFIVVLIGYRSYEYYHQYDNNGIWQRINGGWAIGCWIAMILFLLTIYVYNNYLEKSFHQIAEDTLFLTIFVGGLGIFYSKISRISWLVVLNVIFIFTSIATFISHIGTPVDNNSDTSDVLSNNNVDANNSVDQNHSVDNNYIQNENVSENLNTSIDVFNDIDDNSIYALSTDLLENSMNLYGGFSSYTNGTIAINPFMHFDYLNVDTPVIINNGLGEPQLSLFDGKITDLISNSQIGSYGHDTSLDMEFIYNNDGDRVLALDKSGAVFNSKMELIGYKNDNSVFSTFTNLNGETTLYSHGSGTMFDNKGHLISSIQKQV